MLNNDCFISRKQNERNCDLIFYCYDFNLQHIRHIKQNLNLIQFILPARNICLSVFISNILHILPLISTLMWFETLSLSCMKTITLIFLLLKLSKNTVLIKAVFYDGFVRTFSWKEIWLISYFSCVKYVDLCATIDPSKIEDQKLFLILVQSYYLEET